ncbi:glycosyltransferase [Halobacillus litoralis]|uniref:glycosyltransferase n=1 Tax=Halobacillus litoralis TaxID=45668 RepID=UPI001CFCB023|nr:glycosyltransferase [Halobacillus litoralis]WLR49050.1 glycosyltransferase [Halobacillus litoralis]
MRGLFIHDHKFPRLNNQYFYSYGFDEEFFRRYLDIFNRISVIGREKEVNGSNLKPEDKVLDDIEFLTINDLRRLMEKSVRCSIDKEIMNSDYLVIRVPSILGLYAMKLAEKNKKPYIVEVVGCAWDAISNKGISKRIPAHIITYLMQKAVRKAKYVVYVTEEFLEERYPTNGKYIACSNVTLSSVEDTSIKERISNIRTLQQREKVIIGTCATIDVTYKGQQDVIRALAKLKSDGFNIEYQLVGGGDPTYLKKVAEDFGVFENIKFLGSLKHEKVFEWLDDIDIYIHPSKQEGLSRAIIEAMSRGCPVIGADAGGIHELIDNKYIFDKGDLNKIVHLYKEMDEGEMEDQALKNHESSKKYIKSVLYNRRKNFFNDFIENS